MKLGTIPMNDFQTILQALTEPISPQEVVIRIICESGCRTDEALKIKVRDVNHTNATILIRGSKGSHDRMIPLSFSLLKQIKSLVASHALGNQQHLAKTYTTSTTRAAQRISLQRAMKKLCQRTGLPGYSLHQIRHTCFNEVYNKTQDPLATKQFAGHKSMDSTLVYVHAQKAHVAQVAWSETLKTGEK